MKFVINYNVTQSYEYEIEADSLDDALDSAKNIPDSDIIQAFAEDAATMDFSRADVSFDSITEID